MDWLLPVAAIAVAAALLHPGLRGRAAWRATVTPLASIIGSGFLVIAPLLARIAGTNAWLAVLGIVAVAYGIGAIVRFNIVHAEPLLALARRPIALLAAERVSNVALTLAYMVSVAFYIRLLAAFALEGLGAPSAFAANALATGILGFIGLTGWIRGLHGLESLEILSVTIKLSIIAALLLGFGFHDVTMPGNPGAGADPSVSPLDRMRMLAGLLLVVQGFETSRYLGAEYPAALRVRTMRYAQVVSAAIYVAFIVLATPLQGYLAGGRPAETAIIDLAGYVSASLPLMLILAAAMSQFSAAVADTLAADGLMVEETRGRVAARAGYVVIAAVSIALVWSADVFEIIAWASRAFAFYYMAQSVVALIAAAAARGRRRRAILRFAFAASAGGLLAVVLFAIPVG